MIMEQQTDLVRQRLQSLKHRLEQVRYAWTVDDYWALLELYVDILPVIVPAERCTIFIIEISTEAICSVLGTGLQKIRIEPPKHESIVGQVMSSGQSIIVNDVDSSSGYHAEIAEQTGFITRNLVCVPINSLTGHGVTGAIEVLNRRDGDFQPEDLTQVMRIARHLSILVESIILNREIIRISSQFNRDIERYGQEYFRNIPFIAESPAMKAILEQVRLVSETPVNALIQGENGTGKELIARMIHEESKRKDQPFIAVNCAAIPQNLVESEFFGYEKGAFTGADSARRGYFEEASGGTLFLDEIADMPLNVQPKFLRAIQEGEGYRLGGKRLMKYDLRLISATNKSLQAEVNAGRFREDLFFRLFAVEIALPPLRERKEDIAPMAFAFLEDVCHRFEKRIAGFAPDVLNLFEAYRWPGNVRQLRREIERMVALTPQGERISIAQCSADLSARGSTAQQPRSRDLLDAPLPEQVDALEIALIREALSRSNGNRSRSAELLGISRQGLLKKIARYRLMT
ncbi:sigma54 specific transcriptional regulator, Fis family [Candidatus Moduliflexus flocculans]|uniref:Sigma54 specific transcriptional regulator, Fis family n=1 Tax=Candidatus Moduliflexus flocculans TaxID=1499966 RepID=A0A081BRA2_9BACT|nr:sigma54 specific transcriptional regulator, Fis family [Candidatus Moduliflexus flocculans]